MIEVEAPIGERSSPRARLGVLDGAERVRAALSPPRRQLLELLREPMSATELAARLGSSRQRVGYHLRALEDLGLIELVEERQRRGCTERVLRATADVLVVDPTVLGSVEPSADAQDRFAAEHLVGVASAVVRDVARMQGAAEREGSRLLTFTIEAELSFAHPADVEAFCDRLTVLVREAAEQAHTPGGRPYRVISAGHPAPGSAAQPQEAPRDR